MVSRDEERVLHTSQCICTSSRVTTVINRMVLYNAINATSTERQPITQLLLPHQPTIRDEIM